MNSYVAPLRALKNFPLAKLVGECAEFSYLL
jgi:hypothetical protein